MSCRPRTSRSEGRAILIKPQLDELPYGLKYILIRNVIAINKRILKLFLTPSISDHAI